MRKRILYGLILSVIAFSLVMCSHPVDDAAKPSGGGGGYQPSSLTPKTYKPKTESGKRYQDILKAQTTALDKMLDTISGYYDKNYIKSLSKDGKPLRLEDFSDYFDAGKTREITDEFGNKYETTLGYEITAIAQEFLGEFEQLKPDITELKNTAGAYVVNGDLLLPT